MYQESEIVDLMLVVFLSPLLWAGFRSITVAGKRWFVGAYAAIVAAYVSTVVEGFRAPELFNALEHSAYAVAGILLTIGVTVLVRAVRAESGDR